MKTQDASRQDALNFLRDNNVAVVATCFENKPHATDVYYDVDADFNFFFVTKQNTSKNLHIAVNPYVSIVVGTGPEQITVQYQGKAEMLTGPERIQVMDKIMIKGMEKGVESLPITRMKNLEEQTAVVFKVVPQEVSFMNLNSKKYPKSISEQYHKIISNTK